MRIPLKTLLTLVALALSAPGAHAVTSFTPVSVKGGVGATAVAHAEPNGYVVGTADSGTLAFNP